MTQKSNLMNPRYKVIADYPAQHYSIGDVIDTDNPKLCSVCEDEFWLFDLDKYPHLFRKLEWWEDREISEMPEYVKDKYNQIWKVDCHNKSSFGEHNNYGCLLVGKEYPYCSYSKLVPATETEYLTFINQIQ